MSEAEFRRWLVKNKPTKSMIQPIETSTGAGIPDLYYCYRSSSCWIELKETERTGCYMRVSQWLWFGKLREAGGRGFLIIKRKARRPYTIDIYDIRQFMRQNGQPRAGKLSGKDILFKDIKPVVTVEVASGHEYFYNVLHKLLLKKGLDKDEN